MREFTAAGFAKHLESLAAGMPAFQLILLEQAGVVVEEAAKEKIGHYQEEAGPFSAWAPLKDATKADRTRKGYPADDPLLRAGDLRDLIEHTVVGNTVTIGSALDIAVYQELGTATIPPRSFLGGAMFEQMPRILALEGAQLERYVAGEKIK